jgi:hypothetical protein
MRVEHDVIERLERILVGMRSEFPSFKLSLSDAARMALLEGLLVLEGRAKGRQRKARQPKPPTD